MRKLVLCVLLGVFASVLSQANTIVRFQNHYGIIDVELFDEEKPLTVSNFLAYVTSGAYNNMFLHRLALSGDGGGFVVQGGGFTVNPRGSAGTLARVPSRGAISNEYSVGQRYSNTYGTIAMARVGGQVNSATSEFFFNLRDNSFLDTVDQGFTVFGRIVPGNTGLNQYVDGGGNPDGPWRVNASQNVGQPAMNEVPVKSPPPYISVPAFFNELLYTDVTVLKRHQKITWPAIGDRGYGSGPIALNATLNTGQPVFYEVVSGPVEYLNGALQIRGLGDVVVRAYHPGSDSLSATSTQQTFKIVKGTLTIDFPPIPDRLLNEGSFDLVAGTGLRSEVVTFTVSGPANVNGRRLTPTGVGYVTVKASYGGNDFYNPAVDVFQSFHIKGTINLTASAGGTATKSPNLPSYTNTTLVTFTATPNAGFAFSHWTGDLTGSENPAVVPVTRNLNIRAEFVPALFPLNVNITGSGTVTKAPNKSSYDLGEIVKLTAVPATNAYFVRWTGATNSSSVSVSLEMDAEKTINAVFALRPVLSAFTKTGSQAQFTLTGQPGSSFELLGSVDLVNWTPVSSGVNTSGVVTVSDDNALSARKFYRISQTLP